MKPLPNIALFMAGFLTASSIGLFVLWIMSGYGYVTVKNPSSFLSGSIFTIPVIINNFFYWKRNRG